MDRLNAFALGLPAAPDGIDGTHNAPRYGPARTPVCVASAAGIRRLVSCVMPAYNERDVIGQCEMPVSHHQRRSGRSKVGFGDIPRSLAQVVTLRHSLRNGHGRRDGSGQRP
jgi:hypothetical protein